MAVIALVAAILSQVVATALLGLSLDAFGGLLLVFVGAVLATASAMWWLRRRPQDVPADAARAELRPVLLRLNCWTAVSLLAFFLGVVAHSAGVLFTLEVATAPVAVTIGTARRARSQGITGPGLAQWVGAVTLILIGATTVALIEVDGTSATGLVVSIALGLIAGGSVGAVVMLSERLGSSGAGVAYVMANRFHLTYMLAAVGAVFVFVLGSPAPVGSELALVALAGLATMSVPMYMLQFAMQRMRPLSVTTALATMPVLTLLTELVAGSAPGTLRLVVALLIVPVSAVLVIAQRRRAAPTGRMTRAVTQVGSAR
jgi:drug/metabolite transporter (DMT)-like permease